MNDELTLKRGNNTLTFITVAYPNPIPNNPIYHLFVKVLFFH